MNQEFIDIRYNEKRRHLVEHLKNKGITDINVLEAINSIPRERFIEQSFINRAYDDSALPIICNQTISQPFTVAYMTMILKISPGMKVLEIGTGSGYQAVVLYELGADVYTIERIKDLSDRSTKLFKEMNLKIHTKCGDGTLGWNQHAPYDRIIVTAAAPKIPDSLIEQLAVDGILVIPSGDIDLQTMCIITKNKNGNVQIEYKEQFKFVPLIGQEGWQ